MAQLIDRSVARQAIETLFLELGSDIKPAPKPENPNRKVALAGEGYELVWEADPLDVDGTALDLVTLCLQRSVEDLPTYLVYIVWQPGHGICIDLDGLGYSQLDQNDMAELKFVTGWMLKAVTRLEELLSKSGAGVVRS